MSSPTPIHPTTVGDCVEAFIASLKRRGRSQKTIAKYRPYLDAFAVWAGDRPTASLTAAEIDIGFLVVWSDAFESRHGRPASPQSLRGVIGAVSGHDLCDTR
jgi:hypothetical protein